MKTVNVDMKFKGMNKPQEFIIYPCAKDDALVLIQSDKRIGRVNFNNNTIYLSKGHSNGSYSVDLCSARGAKFIYLTSEEMEVLKAARLKMAGNTNANGTFTLIG